MRNRGFMLVFVLVALAVVAVLAVDLATRQVLAAEASRSRSLQVLGEAGLLAGRLWVDQRMEAVARGAYAAGAAEMRASGEPFDAGALQALRVRLQQSADALVCGQQDPNGLTLRVHFTPTACGEALPGGGPPPARRLGGSSPGLVTYELPFVAVATLARFGGEVAARQQLLGSLLIRAGEPHPAEFELFLAMGTRSTGDPAYLEGGLVFDGPVYLAGLPFFRGGAGPGPYFLGGFYSGLCPALGGGGCAGAAGAPYFDGVGAVQPDALYPSPLAPCYGNACPQAPGGLSWSAPVLAPPAFDPLAQAAVVLPGDGGGADVFLEAASLAGAPAERVRVTHAGATHTLYVTQDRTLLEAPPGSNLTAFATPPADAAAGWSGAAGPSGTPGVVRQSDRDAYYGEWFDLGGARRFSVAFEADPDAAAGPVQVGFLWTAAASGDPFAAEHGWVGTAAAGQAAVPGGGWQSVGPAAVTLPPQAVRARIWTQIDAPWGATGSALLRNLSVSPDAAVRLPLALHPARPRVLAVAGRVASLAGPPDGAAYTGRTPFTVAATGGVTLANSLRSELPPCRSSAGVQGGTVAPSDCDDPAALLAGGARGILGVYSHTGDILLDDGVDHYTLNAALLAPQGAVGLAGYPAGDADRSVSLTGSLAAYYFNGFRNPALASAAPTEGGYATYFSFDPRLASDGGVVPEGWPRLPRGVYGAAVVYANNPNP